MPQFRFHDGRSTAIPSLCSGRALAVPTRTGGMPVRWSFYIGSEPAKRAISCSPWRKPWVSDRMDDRPAPDGRHQGPLQASAFSQGLRSLVLKTA